jgi:hypothetical protein
MSTEEKCPFLLKWIGLDWIGLARQELLPADFGGYIVHGSNKIESRHLP